jgi:type IV pilus assembly protein PilA
MGSVMAHRLRVSIRSDRGFTLIELLVVILIIGILVAIAIPSLLSQKSKAYDAGAKEIAHTGQVAAEAYMADHAGEYTNLSPAALREYEPAIQTAAGNSNAYLSVAEAKEAGKGYVVTAVSPGPGGDTFTITRTGNGEVLRTCKANGANKGGCETGSW